MSPALVSTRLLLILLASTMACPSWLWGDCCCTRRAAAGKSRSCCQSFAKATQKTAPKKRSCCAVIVSADVQSSSVSTLCEPAAPCRCRTQSVAIAFSKPLRSMDRDRHDPCDGFAVRVHHAVTEIDASNVAHLADHECGCPLDAMERCRWLCRWLA